MYVAVVPPPGMHLQNFDYPNRRCGVQDEHPALPDNLSEDMQGFLLECFQKDPQLRPGARALLRHAWLRQQSATLRSAWSNTVKARGGRTDAHASVTDVVERILRVGRMRRLNHASALPYHYAGSTSMCGACFAVLSVRLIDAPSRSASTILAGRLLCTHGSCLGG